MSTWQCTRVMRVLLDRALHAKKVHIRRSHNSRSAQAIDLSRYPPERVRNFCIIAHVDHGKSTLADRLLEVTGVISSECKNEQVLDRLQVERERGITVKAQSATMLYGHAASGATYLLNLIDTPGHVDFHYEVERSLSACQGVILLVDANEGVQAQTLANFYLAFEAELTIIPVLNKIDLKGAQPDEVQAQLETLFGILPKEVLRISAKHGTGVATVLDAVVERVPPPQADVAKPLSALLFDSSFDQYRGAVVNVAVRHGSISKGDKIMSCHLKKKFEVQEVGILQPHEVPMTTLYAGQVGYVIPNMKSTGDAIIGDTLCFADAPVEPLKSFKQAKPMVFAGFFPVDQSEHGHLKSAIEKLTLNDSSVQMNADSSAALGQGWRLGFLGLLHMDVFKQRLEQEHNAQVIITAPNVPFKVKIHGARNIKFHGSEQMTILNPCHLPDESIITEFQEPMVLGTIIFPDQYLSDIISLCMSYRGSQKDQVYIDSKRVLMKVLFPLNEIVINFFDDLKALTSGYASFDYEDAGYQVTNLVKLTILLNGKEVEELTSIVHHSRAHPVGKLICQKLQQAIPRQLFEVAIQASSNGRVVARETVKAVRKNVLAKCYGGDVSRKMKLLSRQAEGKERMRKVGNVEVPRDAFISVLRK